MLVVQKKLEWVLGVALSKTIEPIQRLLKALIGIDKLIIDTLNELEFEIEEYQRGQLLKGQLSTGDLITPKYKPFTIKQKEKDPRYKAPSDTPNLLDTGDYYDSIMAKVKNKFIEITATDSKSTDLEKKYSDKILGWNKETKDAFCEDVLFPTLKEKLRSIANI